jgi:hypothetical protein
MLVDEAVQLIIDDCETSTPFPEIVRLIEKLFVPPDEDWVNVPFAITVLV